MPVPPAEESDGRRDEGTGSSWFCARRRELRGRLGRGRPLHPDEHTVGPHRIGVVSRLGEVEPQVSGGGELLVGHLGEVEVVVGEHLHISRRSLARLREHLSGR